MERLTGTSFERPPPHVEVVFEAGGFTGGLSMRFFALTPEEAKRIVEGPTFLTRPLSTRVDPTFWHDGPLTEEDKMAIENFVWYYRSYAPRNTPLKSTLNDLDVLERMAYDPKVFRLCKANRKPQANNGCWAEIDLIDPATGLMIVAYMETT